MKVEPAPDLPLAVDQAAIADVVGRLSDGRYDDLEWYLLRREAERAALLRGFDELLGLDLNRIDEYPHQVRVATVALQQMRGRALLADEVGLGKTIEAGLVLKEYVLRGLVSRILVLVPASLTVQWQEELESKFDERFVINSDEDGWLRRDKVIASIDTAKRENHAAVICSHPYDLVIVDEAHRLRNRRTLAWQFVNRIRKKYMLLLTATPVHNRLEELYNIVTLLKPGLLGTPRQFRRRFVVRGEPRQPQDTVRLKGLLRQAMIRTRRSEAMVVLPPRKAYTYKVSLSRPERALYEKGSAALRAAGADGLDAMSISVTLRELCSSPAAAGATFQRLSERGLSERERLSSLCRRVFRNLAAECDDIDHPSKIAAVRRIVGKARDRVLVFTDFRRTQESLVADLMDAGHDTITFHGGLSRAEKEEAVSRFRAGRSVLVCTGSGAEGRNLQFCNVMINYDIPWNPLLIEQRIGRLHRIGQDQEVYVFNLGTSGTIEERILRLLNEKLRMFELVVGELDLVLGRLEGRGSIESAIHALWLRALDDTELDTGLEKLGDDLVQARDRFADIKEAELVVSKIFE